MGLGSTAKKIQNLADTAEELYNKLTEVREQIDELRGQVEETSSRVRRLEVENAEQRALVEALAEERDIDVESALASAHIDDVDEDVASDADPETGVETAED